MGSGITIPGQIPNDRRIIGIPVRGLPTATLLQIQWNDTDKVFEFVALAGGGVSGDLAFQLQKDFAGELITVEGTLGAAGDLVSITAAAGKDIYISKANIVPRRITVANAQANCLSELKANAIIKETKSASAPSGTTTTSMMGTIYLPFAWVGKVAETEIIKIELITVLNMTTDGFLSVIAVDTGVDPTA